MIIITNDTVQALKKVRVVGNPLSDNMKIAPIPDKNAEKAKIS